MRQAAEYVSSGAYLKQQLPYIHGTWFFVDGKDGADTRSGQDPSAPLLTLLAAYNKCTTGRGDGICLFSRSISGTTYSFSMTESLLWSKYGITVIGVAAPTAYFSRAKIVAGTANLVYLINVSGQNNTFLNLFIANEGTANTCIGNVIVSGNWNYFGGCHLLGGVSTVPAAIANCASLDLRSSECVFEGCTFGTNSTLMAPASGVSAPILFSTTQQGQNLFRKCIIRTKMTGNVVGGINIQGAATMNGWTEFDGCIFTNWYSGAATAGTKLVVGTSQNDCGILLHSCSQVGWAAWSVLAQKVYVGCSAETAAGAGGIASAPAA